MVLCVFKYPVSMEAEFSIDLPKGAQILKFDVQRDKPMMWALVDSDAVKQRRWFRIAGTGHPIDYPQHELRFVSTFFVAGGALVFHVFEILGK